MKEIPSELVLDCWEDELSETQLMIQAKANREYKEFQRKIHEVYDMVNTTQSGLNVPSQPLTAATTNQLMLQNVQPSQMNGSFVVVEPNNHVKFVVQPISSASQPGQMITSNAAMRMQTNTTAATFGRDGYNTLEVDISKGRAVSLPGGIRATRATLVKPTAARPMHMADLNRPRSSFKPRLLFSARNQNVPPQVQIPVQLAQKKKNILQDAQLAQGQKIPAALRPANRKVHDTEVVDLTLDDIGGDESSHIGGILPGSEKSLKDASEKTFPSLVVVARAHLANKSISPSEESAARSQLDSRVKKILVLPAQSLTEWLLQQKLIRSSQKCAQHGLELKLGMYSDLNRLPYSGGYVWVSECCPTIMTSVYSGSIFEGAPYAPTVLLKLIYHWSCQTTVQNVLLWVRVSNLYVKTMYTNLRAICTAVIHHHFPVLGGPQKIVEVGLISLGTTTGDGILKQVKVEVLGIFEESTNRIRLKAMEPVQDADKFKRKKFIRILDPLKQWIAKSSIIITDICADDPAWKEAGFINVRQSSSTCGLSNKNIMSYIRNIVPRMFQNTLSLLSRQIIQQFLDELVWRETWGPIPSLAHERMMKDLSELTKLDSGGSLVNRLMKISANPFKDWHYKNWEANCVPPKPVALPPTQNSTPSNDPFKKYQLDYNSMQQSQSNNKNRRNVKAKVFNDEENLNLNQAAPGRDGQVYLESYYYGTYEGENPYKLSPLYTECAICLKEFRDNAQFTDHLILHALNEQYPYCDLTKDVCRICLTVPETTMNAHVNQHHRDTPNKRTVCKICNVPKKAVCELIKHMITTHNELELPYTCDICYFRTSIFEDVQTHFNTVHKNCCSAQCPFCLKIVSFVTPTGEDIIKNQIYFIRHIQRHQLPFAKKCDRCALSFINIMSLRDHQEKKHISCKTFHGIKRYLPSDGGILMPDPQGKTIPITLTENDDDSLYIEHGLIEPRSKEDRPVVTENLSFLLCRECDGPLIPSHFTSVASSCEKCAYKSNCTYALSEHILTWHGTRQFKASTYHWFEKGNISAPIQPKPLHCAQCLFTSSNGNDMASHMLLNCNNSFCTRDKRKAQLAIGLDIVPELSRKRKKKKKDACMMGYTRRNRKRAAAAAVANYSVEEETEEDDFPHDPIRDSPSVSLTSEAQTDDTRGFESESSASNQQENDSMDLD